MNNDSKEDLIKIMEGVSYKLNLMLNLLIDEKFDEDTTNKEKIEFLYSFGLSNKEMAQILETSEGSVRGTLSSLREQGRLEDK